MDIEDQIPPLLPLPSGSETALGRRQRGGIPLFGKWFDGANHPEIVEGEGLMDSLVKLPAHRAGLHG